MQSARNVCVCVRVLMESTVAKLHGVYCGEA
jgi:hypothetical protein